MSRYGYTPEELRMLQAGFFEEVREQLDAILAAVESLRHVGPGAQAERAAATAVLMRELHTLKGSAGTVEIDDLAQRAHDLEERLILVRSSNAAAPSGLEALLRDCEALPELTNQLCRDAQFANSAGPPGAAEVAPIAPQGSSEWPPPQRSHDTDERERAWRLAAHAVPERLPVALGPERLSASLPPQSTRSQAATLRVEVERIDELINAIGELVIGRTRLNRRLLELGDCVRGVSLMRQRLRFLERSVGVNEVGSERETSSLPARHLPLIRGLTSETADLLLNLERAVSGMREDIDQLRRPSQTLQQGLQAVRMVKVGRLWRRLEAPVRELARREGKDVELVIEGAETQIDKSVVERIADPLLHLVRNAVAHGIEPPVVRTARGKPARGRIALSAAHRGSQVIIEVNDDGQGVDRARVREALSRIGWQDAHGIASLDDDEVVNAIFAHGLSTRIKADNLAGRGVGLDAVRESIAALGGDITVSSTVGIGTRFTVRLPLTTAIVQALLFKVGGQVYAVPLASVAETAHVRINDVELGADAERVTIRGTRMPVVRLGALLHAPTPPGASDRRWAVVLEHDDLRFAFTCDKVIGPREVVIKSLGPLLSSVRLFAGATISGAGKVQLILDLGTLTARARQGETPGLRPSAQGSRRVLVVDDSRSMRDAVALFLRQSGYAVETAADGAVAWELLQEQAFDLLITDLEMPRLDGWELVSRVRHHGNLRQMKVLAMSSRASLAAQQRAAHTGADSFIAKPLSRRALLDAVRQVLTARPHRSL